MRSGAHCRAIVILLGWVERATSARHPGHWIPTRALVATIEWVVRALVWTLKAHIRARTITKATLPARFYALWRHIDAALHPRAAIYRAGVSAVPFALPAVDARFAIFSVGASIELGGCPLAARTLQVKVTLFHVLAAREGVEKLGHGLFFAQLAGIEGIHGSATSVPIESVAAVFAMACCPYFAANFFRIEFFTLHAPRFWE